MQSALHNYRLITPQQEPCWNSNLNKFTQRNDSTDCNMQQRIIVIITPGQPDAMPSTPSQTSSLLPSPPLRQFGPASQNPQTRNCTKQSVFAFCIGFWLRIGFPSASALSLCDVIVWILLPPRTEGTRECIRPERINYGHNLVFP